MNSIYKTLYLRCESCGWITVRTKSNPNKSLEKCEACGEAGKPVSHMDVACLVMTLADLRSERLRQHADKHNLKVIQLSKYKWIIVEDSCYSSVSYGDGAVRAFRTMRVVQGSASWQDTAKYIRKNTPDLPNYLAADDG